MVELLRLVDRNNLIETQDKQVSRIMNGLKTSIWDMTGLQPIYTFNEAKPRNVEEILDSITGTKEHSRHHMQRKLQYSLQRELECNLCCKIAIQAVKQLAMQSGGKQTAHNQNFITVQNVRPPSKNCYR